MRVWCLAALLVLAATSTADALPIPDPLPTTLPRYQGAPATSRPLPATVAPQNPHLARDPRSNIHNDTWMTDAYRHGGPLGRSPVAFSGAMAPALCGSLTFHSHGYIVSVCPSVLTPPQARVIDPDTLEVLATYDMPNAPDPPGTQAYQNFAGGGYFFLDARDRIWSATKTSHIFVLAVSQDGRTITQDRRLRPQRASSPRTSGSARRCPTSRAASGSSPRRAARSGSSTRARAGSGSCASARTSRTRSPSTAAAVYVVSSRRMYRFSARDGKPRVDWKVRYRNSGVVKPGQADAGSGHDADDHERRLRRDHRQRGPDERRRLPEGEAAAARAAAGRLRGRGVRRGRERDRELADHRRRSLFVENNYGYQDPFGPSSGALTTPGFARVDVNRGGTGCRKVWTNRTERAPTVVAKLSTRTGLIYTYTRDEAPLARPALLLDRDRRADGRDGLEGIRRERPRLQQQLRRPGARPRRHGLSGRDGRDRRAARPVKD